jgi:hypothetical protein
VIVPHRFAARVPASERRASSIRAFPESAVDWRAALGDSRALTLAQAF